MLMISELSSDDYQSDDGMDCEDDDQETDFQVDSRIRVKPEFMTVLELNSNTITQYLKPFRSQLTNPYLSNLAEFPEVKPYITTTPSTKKSVEDDSSSDESYLPVDEDISPNQRRRRAVMNPKVFYYPLTEQQIFILNQFRQAQTLIFTSLPSQDCIMKLIALSVMVSQPFYGQVLFPNVEKVVYSSAMQEKSLVDRYAFLGSTFDPHPITFALDWLVYDFSLCIHSTSASTRNQWIEKGIKNDKSDSSEAALKSIYLKKWNTLNPLGGTVIIDRLPGLKSISYHNILPGDRPQFSSNLETFLYFGRHEDPDLRSVNVTLRAIAQPISDSHNSFQMPISKGLHLVNIECLGYVTSHKPGPKAMEQGLTRRGESLKRLLKHIMALCDSGGRELEQKEGKMLWAMLQAGASESLCDSFCDTCEGICEEASCSKLIGLGIE
jgi:hypothetical protein